MSAADDRARCRGRTGRIDENLATRVMQLADFALVGNSPFCTRGACTGLGSESADREVSIAPWLVPTQLGATSDGDLATPTARPAGPGERFVRAMLGRQAPSQLRGFERGEAGPFTGVFGSISSVVATQVVATTTEHPTLRRDAGRAVTRRERAASGGRS